MIEYTLAIAELEYYLLIFVRISCFVFVVPFFNMGQTPKRVRVALSFFIAYLLYGVLTPHEPIRYNTVLEYALLVLKEGITGVLIGFGASICNSIVLFAGRVVDMEIGLAMASQFDPTTKEQASISGIYYQYMVTLLLLISGMYKYLIQALAETFSILPIGGAKFVSDKLLTVFIRFMGDYLSVGFRICLPIFCVSIILSVVLGILAKVAPQMNMFAVGMQIKVLVGISILFLTVGMLPYISDFIFTEIKTMTVSFVEAMM